MKINQAGGMFLRPVGIIGIGEGSHWQPGKTLFGKGVPESFGLSCKALEYPLDLEKQWALGGSSPR